MSPLPASTHGYAQAKAAPSLFAGEKAGLWVSAAHKQMQISGQRYQTGDISVGYFLCIRLGYFRWLPQQRTVFIISF